MVNSDILARFGTFSLFNSLKQFLVDVWENTSVGNRGVGQQSVQLLIVPDRQKNVSRVDSIFLVVLCCVTGQFQNLNSKSG